MSTACANRSKMSSSPDGRFVPTKDPWERLDAWRRAPGINRASNIRRMFPGLGIGFGAFVIAVGVETIMKGDEKSKEKDV